jgi:hypothetical protein
MITTGDGFQVEHGVGGVNVAESRSDQGYGRRWPKYVLIYLVVAAVLYGLIYLIFFSDAFTGGGGGSLY